jgi:hypothetical protein
MGVSYGFIGSPLILDLEEYETLATLGVQEGGKIVQNFEAEEEIYFLAALNNHPTLNTEKKCLNICRFLNADKVISTKLNSILNLNLKVDIVVIYQGKALCFQAKSSLSGARKYEDHWLNKKLNPYYKRSENCQRILPKLPDMYIAPGVVYLDVTCGNKSLFSFLMEMSKWLGIEVQEDYIKILKYLWSMSKPIHMTTLERAFKSKSISSEISKLGGICPIVVNQGFVYLNGKRKEVTLR